MKGFLNFVMNVVVLDMMKIVANIKSIMLKQKIMELNCSIAKLSLKRKSLEDNDDDDDAGPAKRSKSKNIGHAHMVETPTRAMLILSWNCQGVGRPRTISYLRGLIRVHRPTVVFVMETKNKQRKLDRIRRSINMPNAYYVDPAGQSGGLALWWLDSINLLVSVADKTGGNSDISKSIEELQGFINDANLLEIPFKGVNYSWTNNREESHNIRERIDRVLVNADWMELYPLCLLSHEPLIGSDHTPLLLNTEPRKHFHKRFRFETMWTRSDQCEAIIKHSWKQGIDCPPDSLQANLGSCPFNSNSFVSDFITAGRWNVNKLRIYVSDEAILDIQSIPLSLTDVNDRLVWHYSSKGTYTVKSGYNIALKLREDGLHQSDCFSHQASSSLVPDKSFWNLIWSISAQPKLKNFMWRICTNAIATRENLFKRKCSPFVGWSIWLARNKFVFDNVPVCPNSVLKASCSAQSEFSSLLQVSCPESRCCVSATSPLQSELIAIREACLIIRHHHLFNACIESDCKSAISFCSTESAPPWDSAVLIEDIRSIVATFHIWILFVPRSCNGAAHWVAHQACLKNLPPNWVFDPPDQLSSLLRSDSGSCS
ncbi:hypothetical protein DCAR_0626366 [Daucus carota subsp. sativus]|uniref:Reverse transcriptase zinc-binding domain-containing protein n=1 Tax=Daucus carota subsp. sativus TaxID=79200 RepID=A0AAF1B7Q8_DAUCS|nr:hypothetical protein DCAR_0626366 [Daucus carota subsp. sativus]